MASVIANSRTSVVGSIPLDVSKVLQILAEPSGQMFFIFRRADGSYAMEDCERITRGPTQPGESVSVESEEVARNDLEQCQH